MAVWAQSKPGARASAAKKTPSAAKNRRSRPLSPRLRMVLAIPCSTEDHGAQFFRSPNAISASVGLALAVVRLRMVRNIFQRTFKSSCGKRLSRRLGGRVAHHQFRLNHDLRHVSCTVLDSV